MGNLWSPIVAVTSRWRGQANAQICVSIAAASIVPEKPRVLAQIYKTNHTHGMVLGSGAFALNFPVPTSCGGSRTSAWYRDGTATKWPPLTTNRALREAL